MYSSYVPKVNLRNGVMSDFTIDVDFEATDGDFTTTIVVDNVGGNTASNLVLQVAITESQLPIVWGLTQVQDFVNRLMVPNQNGTPLNFSSGSTQTVVLNFSTASWWAVEHCEIVAFVQNNATKEILQGTKKSMATPLFNLDVALIDILNLPEIGSCLGEITPGVEFKNYGAEVLTSLNVNYCVNGGDVITVPWTGSIEFLESFSVQELLPIGFTLEDLNTVDMTLSDPNGGVDENPDNDSMSKDITTAPHTGTTVQVILKTDNYPEQTSYEFRNSAGDVLYTEGPFTEPNHLYNLYFDFQYTDCYEFEIFDTGGNGISGNGFFTLRSNNVTFYSGGSFEYSQIIEFIVDGENPGQTISLESGFQFKSTYIDPSDPDMMNICADVLESIDYVRNSNGSMLRKIGPNWVNNIGDWITTEGYLFKATEAASFMISGTQISYSTPIILPNGFTFISYLPETAMDALIAFETILTDNLEYVRNSQGSMVRKIGPNWVNNIGNAMPSEGYLVKLLGEETLVYPDCGKLSIVSKLTPQHFIFEGGNAADPVYTIYADGLEIGDEVAVFDGNKMLGSTIISSENALSNDIAVFNTLNSGNGYEAGNKISFKVWSNESNSEVAAEYLFTNTYANAYINYEFPSNDGEYSFAHFTKNSSLDENEANVSIYPNPVKNSLNIDSKEIIKNIQVFNYLGSLVFEQDCNSNSVKVNTSDYIKGMYLVQINTINGISTKRLVIQ
ncbi:MAG: T9SS type A sorting domain-containing protein [Bacteroidales bacterium]|nr:T9SS type A sorting domain-containing protein [Bacteroidales bacterium]